MHVLILFACAEVKFCCNLNPAEPHLQLLDIECKFEKNIQGSKTDKLLLSQDFEECRNSIQHNHSTLSPINNVSIIKDIRENCN